jgi:hypothetical protein
MLKFFTKQKSIYGANVCFFNGMTLQVMTLFVMETIRHKLISGSLEQQVQIVFESWFEVYSTKRDPVVLGNQMIPQDEFFGSNVARLCVYTPIEATRNAAANIVGSNYLAIIEEIKKVHYLFKCKKIGALPRFFSDTFTLQNHLSNTHFYATLFKPQEMPLQAIHKNFLRIDLVNSDPTFYGFFESRVKNLRERLENGYLLLQQQQRHMSKDSTGGSENPETPTPNVNLIAEVSPVLIKKIGPNLYFISLPFSTIVTSWHKA